MSRKHSFVHDLRVASPCQADWNNMTGDERVRFCHDCKLNVYNISEMTTEEAEQLIIEKEGRLCVRMYRRKDGTLLNMDCPIGRVKKRFLAAFCAVSAVASLIAVWFLNARPSVGAATQTETPPSCAPQHHVMGKIRAIPRTTMGEISSNWINGDVAVSSTIYKSVHGKSK